MSDGFELNEKSLKTLEYDKILEKLKSHAVCSDAALLAEKLKPINSLDEVLKLLNETEDAVRLMGKKGSPNFYNIRNCDMALMRAEKGAALSLKELLDIALILKTSRMLIDYIDENTSMVEELGRNQPARDAYLMGIHNGPKPVLYQSFRTAAENFELIGQDTVGIIVDYKNHDLLEQLEKAFVERDYNCIRNLLKKLQRYTVNMYITSKILPFIIYKQEYNVYLLQKEYYDEKRGVTIEHLADLIF